MLSCAGDRTCRFEIKPATGVIHDRSPFRRTSDDALTSIIADPQWSVDSIADLLTKTILSAALL